MKLGPQSNDFCFDMEARGTLFREIHKNTWLKRLTVDNKKITVGPKVSDIYCDTQDMWLMDRRCIPVIGIRKFVYAHCP